MLSYNIAGLPEGLSSGDPRVNTPIIGQRIRPYDIVHVQEDFNYHASFYANNTHPFRTPTSGGVPFGDGLNTVSDHPYSDLTRDKWDRCNGTDCLTPKGFSWSRIRVAEGVLIDFYNVHSNAGSAEPDLAARRANISELSRFITANSAGNAVVVAGDTNTRYTRTGDNIRELLTTNGLTDAWIQEELGGVPPAAGSPAAVCDDQNVTDACEVVDKILYRGNRYITLDLNRYGNENAAFRTADNKMLSDHYPIAADSGGRSTPRCRSATSSAGHMAHRSPMSPLCRCHSGSQEWASVRDRVSTRSRSCSPTEPLMSTVATGAPRTGWLCRRGSI
ncbi:hypothetical protein GCM10011609_06130 [Lentzea pudingi]|uniref:Inositol polyphosphate-related phosphatase domain-containing protein n=1 Tax=Lentzea pudingi TaxID=1789439 RepID=A0ABQ2HBV8_9PSEU|nr:hypothetical protein GCM10011609_06130 [Lentzea pudingi]